MTEPLRDAGTNPWFERVVAPILRDLRATCAASFEVRDARWEGRSIEAGISFVMGHSLGAETRVAIVASGDPSQDIADTADKVQDVATDALWFEGLLPVWPECPAHAGSHALLATVVSQRPVWLCPLDRDVVAEVGALSGGVIEREVLRGGVANVGAVVRVGDNVSRPANPHSPTIDRFLVHVAERADIAPRPTAPPTNEHEQLRFITGDVPIPPYAEWAQRDEALASTAALIRSLHEASRSFPRRGSDTWSTEMADPTGDGSVICHNDVCLENVVFRDGVAVALLDFDFAAPGRPTHDLACFARMCVPIDDDVSRRNLGWLDADLPRRLRLVADTYGLDSSQRGDVVASLDHSIRNGGEFVRRHAEAGEPGFVAMWEEIGGMARFDRRRDWWARRRDSFISAMK